MFAVMQACLDSVWQALQTSPANLQATYTQGWMCNTLDHKPTTKMAEVQFLKVMHAFCF